MKSLQVTWLLLEKDLRAELRSREGIVTMGVFALLTVTVFSLAFEPTAEESRRVVPGLLWIAYTFSALLGLNRSFALEREAGALTGLLLAPVDRGAIYLGKMLANALFVAFVELLVLPVTAIFFNVRVWEGAPRLALIGALGALAFSAAGTAFAGIAANTRMRELLTPLLLLPAAVPVLVAAVEGTAIVLRGEEAGFGTAVRILAGFSVIFATASYLVFEYVIEE